MFALQYDEDGNWLDSPILVESVGTHEGPDFHEDQQAYLDAYASLESLAHYIGTLQQLRGINQHYAQEAYDHIQGWSEVVPKAYYSTHLSQTQYQYTQENLAKAFWQKLKELFQWIIRMFKKALRLIKDEPKPLEDAQAQRFGKMVSSLEKEINYGFKMEIDGHEKIYHSLNEILIDLMSSDRAPQEYKKIFFTHDWLWRDMVTNGPYTQFLVGQTHLVNQMSTFMRGRLSGLANVFKALQANDKVAASHHLEALKHHTGTIELVSIQKEMMRIRMLAYEEESHDNGHSRDYTLYAQQARYYWRTQSVEKIFEIVTGTAPDAVKIIDVNEKIQAAVTDLSRYFDDSNFGQTLLGVINSVNEEASAAAMIIQHMQSYVQHHRICMKSSYALTRYFMRKIMPFTDKNGNDDVVSKVQQELESVMKA